MDVIQVYYLILGGGIHISDFIYIQHPFAFMHMPKNM